MISHQTLRRLVYFAAIAEAGSIRGAAKRLNLSVPVLSEAMSELEADLGVSLATRTTRKFNLTQAGVRAASAARQILETAQNLTELSGSEKPLSGVLGITIPVELAGFWMPDKISAFRARHPDVGFDIDVTDQVVDLNVSKIEVAIRTEYVAFGAKSRALNNLPLVVVTKEPVPIGANGKVALPLIDSDMNRKLIAASRRDGRQLSLAFLQTHRVTNRTAALELVRAGIGATMVMRGSVEAELATGRLFELMPEHDFGSIDLYYRFRDRFPGPTAQAFAASLNLDPA